MSLSLVEGKFISAQRQVSLGARHQLDLSHQLSDWTLGLFYQILG